MNALENMGRKKLTVAGMVVAAIFLFFINIWSSLEIQTAQLDLTENSLYTLSQGSKEVIKTIEETITFLLLVKLVRHTVIILNACVNCWSILRLFLVAR